MMHGVPFDLKVWGGAILLLLLLVLGVAFARKRRGRRLGSDEACQARIPFFTPEERSFFELLKQVASPRFLVFPKVRLCDLVALRSEGSSGQGAWDRLASLRADFVLVESSTLRPVAVVEREDPAHERGSRRPDPLLEQVLFQAAIPLVRVPAQAAASLPGMKRELERHLPDPDLTAT